MAEKTVSVPEPNPKWRGLVEHIRRLLIILTVLVQRLRSPHAFRRITVVAHPEMAHAHQCAATRRGWLERLIEGVGRGEFRFIETVEIPEAFMHRYSHRPLPSTPEALAQMVRLRWQRERDELLLLERVADAVRVIRSTLEAEGQPHPGDVSVRLEWAGQSYERRGLFPWTVVVTTDHPELLKPQLVTVGDWLGIAVDLEPAPRIRALGRCQRGQGLEGVVGGFVADVDSGQKFAMTCDHVLASECLHRYCPTVPLAQAMALANRHSSQIPDVVLLDDTAEVHNGCFPAPGTPRLCQTATDGLINDCLRNRRAVVVFHPKLKRRTGIIQARVSEVPIGQIDFQFPHLLVVRRRLVLFGGLLKWPLVDRHFSRPGCSGSWVIDEATGAWLGMVAGAAEEQGNAYIIEARPLLEWLTQLLDKPTAHLAPMSWIN